MTTFPKDLIASMIAAAMFVIFMSLIVFLWLMLRQKSKRVDAAARHLQSERGRSQAGLVFAVILAAAFVITVGVTFAVIMMKR